MLLLPDGQDTFLDVLDAEVRVLFVPNDPAMIAPGIGGMRYPLAWRAKLALEPVWRLRAPSNPRSGFPVERALVCAWDGAVVSEGIDRLARALNEDRVKNGVRIVFGLATDYGSVADAESWSRTGQRAGLGRCVVIVRGEVLVGATTPEPTP